MPTLLSVFNLELETRQSTVSIYAKAEEETSPIFAHVSTSKWQPCLMKITPVSLFLVVPGLTTDFYSNVALHIKGSRNRLHSCTQNTASP